MNLFSLLLFSDSAQAASGGHGSNEIPWDALIIPQLINFSIVVVLLLFLVRKPVANYFADKYKKFNDERRKSEEAQVFAEREYYNLKKQLEELNARYEESISTAKKESRDLREKMIKEAIAAASRMKEDSQKVAQFELQSAALQVRLELVQKAVELAKSDLHKRTGATEQHNLQAGFVEKIQGVAN